MRHLAGDPVVVTVDGTHGQSKDFEAFLKAENQNWSMFCLDTYVLSV